MRKQNRKLSNGARNMVRASEPAGAVVTAAGTSEGAKKGWEHRLQEVHQHINNATAELRSVNWNDHSLHDAKVGEHLLELNKHLDAAGGRVGSAATALRKSYTLAYLGGAHYYPHGGSLANVTESVRQAKDKMRAAIQEEGVPPKAEEHFAEIESRLDKALGRASSLSSGASKKAPAKASEPTDDNEKETVKAKSVIHCKASGSPLQAKKTWEVDKPIEFMWMPGGVHTIHASYGRSDGDQRPIELTVLASEEGAKQVQSAFEAIRAASPRRPPFICIEHQAKERAGEPLEFFWKTDPEPAIYCRCAPSELGCRNVNGKIHTSFSPTFDTDAEYHKMECTDCRKTPAVCACESGAGWRFPEGARGSRSLPARVTAPDVQSVGSLTNWNAFRDMLPIAAREKAVVEAAGTSEGVKKSWEKRHFGIGTVHVLTKDVASRNGMGVLRIPQGTHVHVVDEHPMGMRSVLPVGTPGWAMQLGHGSSPVVFTNEMEPVTNSAGEALGPEEAEMHKAGSAYYDAHGKMQYPVGLPDSTKAANTEEQKETVQAAGTSEGVKKGWLKRAHGWSGRTADFNTGGADMGHHDDWDMTPSQFSNLRKRHGQLVQVNHVAVEVDEKDPSSHNYHVTFPDGSNEIVPGSLLRVHGTVGAAEPHTAESILAKHAQEQVSVDSVLAKARQRALGLEGKVVEAGGTSEGARKGWRYRHKGLGPMVYEDMNALHDKLSDHPPADEKELMELAKFHVEFADAGHTGYEINPVIKTRVEKSHQWLVNTKVTDEDGAFHPGGKFEPVYKWHEKNFAQDTKRMNHTIKAAGTSEGAKKSWLTRKHGHFGDDLIQKSEEMFHPRDEEATIGHLQMALQAHGEADNEKKNAAKWKATAAAHIASAHAFTTGHAADHTAAAALHRAASREHKEDHGMSYSHGSMHLMHSELSTGKSSTFSTSTEEQKDKVKAEEKKPLTAETILARMGQTGRPPANN